MYATKESRERTIKERSEKEERTRMRREEIGR